MGHGALRHVVFDLDGTITDSAPGITRCLAHAVRAVEGRSLALEPLRRFIGTPLVEILSELLARPEDEAVERAVGAYIERFDRAGIYENEVYPGVVDVLDTLAEDGCALYVATSKTESAALRVLEHFGLRARFRGVFGMQRDRKVAGKVGVLRRTLRAGGFAGDAAAMVGDRHHDVEAALVLGLRPIGVAWGYGSRAELTAARADAIAERPADLLTLIRREATAR